MSSAIEMNALVIEAASSSPSPRWKDRVQAAARVLNLPFSRAKAYYYRAPRRVSAEEMDNARSAIAALREQRARAKADELVGNLNRTLAYLRTSDPDLYRDEISGLERVLDRRGLLDRALAETAAGVAPTASKAEAGE